MLFYKATRLRCEGVVNGSWGMCKQRSTNSLLTVLSQVGQPVPLLTAFTFPGAQKYQGNSGAQFDSRLRTPQSGRHWKTAGKVPYLFQNFINLDIIHLHESFLDYFTTAQAFLNKVEHNCCYFVSKRSEIFKLENIINIISKFIAQ